MARTICDLTESLLGLSVGAAAELAKVGELGVGAFDWPAHAEGEWLLGLGGALGSFAPLNRTPERPFCALLNLKWVRSLQEFAAAKGVLPIQLSLAWVLAQGAILWLSPASSVSAILKRTFLRG